MKKDRIRKYLIATLATLFTFAAVFVVNELSLEEAYADDLTWSLDLSGAQIKCSNENATNLNSKIEQIHVKITCNNTNDPIKDGDVSLIEGRISDDTLSSYSMDSEATYSIELSDPVLSNGYTVGTSGFTLTGDMQKGENNISYTASPTITTTAKKLSWSASQTPTFYYSDGNTSYTGPSVTGYSGSIVIGSSNTPISDTLRGDVIDVTGLADSATIHVTDASLNGATKSRIKSGEDNASARINGNEILFSDMSGVGIITTSSQVNWSATITNPTVYPSTATISKYKATVTGTSGFSQTFNDLELSNGKISGTIAVPNDSTQYSIRIDSVTLTSGSVSSLSGNTDSGKTISGGQISFSIPNLVVTGLYSDIVNAYSTSEKFVETETKDSSDKIVLEKLTISKDKAKAIIAAQTDETIQAKVIDAIKKGDKLSIKVEFSNGSDESKAKEKIESKAKDDGGTIAKYFDISVYLCTGTDGTTKFTTKKITDIGSDKLSFSFSVPSSISSSSSSGRGKKYYRLYKYHDGAEAIDDWKEGTSFDFSERKFSTYGLAYKYENSAPSASTPTNSASLPSQGNDPGTGGGTDKSKTPKTGDDFNPRIWIYLLIVCATVASAAWILLQDIREDNEKKQN